MKFLGMGGFEFVIIIIVVLLIFGPKNLPKLGSALGKTVSNLRSGMNEGKKKKEEETAAEEASAEDDEPAHTQPAEITGEVETVEFAEEVAEGEAEQVVAEDVEEGAEEEVAAEDAEDADEGAEGASEGVAAERSANAEPQPSDGSQAAAPKKVRRVVKKKVAP